MRMLITALIAIVFCSCSTASKKSNIDYTAMNDSLSIYKFKVEYISGDKIDYST